MVIKKINACNKINLVVIYRVAHKRWWFTEFVKTIHRQQRTSSEEKSDGFHRKWSKEFWAMFNVQVAAVLSYSNAVHGTNIVLITEKV